MTLQYENGRLVKVDGMRPEYMDGYQLIDLVRKLAAAGIGPIAENFTGTIEK